ncbi:O-antigen ligase family protein [Pedobacter aquae]|uniref:O-antigen ligase family protein n=1 Tax=Pedobacter aquae TaxID=2605747 RepID=UPI00143DA8C2|nr:O-antigen ligase family protein [Pedobacter aquae]
MSLILFLLVLIFKTNKVSAINISFFVFGLWCFYPLLISEVFTHQNLYRLSALMFYVVGFYIINRQNITIIFFAICVVATFESIICLLQYFKILDSQNIYFTVTGTSQNPNVIAMFLALSLPSVFYIYSFYKNNRRKMIGVIIILICTALILLKCRSAIIGAGFGVVVFYTLTLKIFKIYKAKHIIIVLFIGIGLLIPIVKYMYLNKKDSADGRKLIWNISTQMILDSPFKGYGIGMFEREYNLKQAWMIRNEQIESDDLKNADFVKMAYNDYIETAIEGGLLYLLLFLMMLIILLTTPFWKYENKEDTEPKIPLEAQNASYAAITMFSLIALFNFEINAIPVFLLFSFYASILSQNTLSVKLPNKVFVKHLDKPALGFVLIVSFYILFWHINQSKAHLKNKKAADFLKEGKHKKAQETVETLKLKLKVSESYHNNFGSILLAQEKYLEALAHFETAKKLTSNPSIYEKSAICNIKLKNRKDAIMNYEFASSLSPKTMNYKYNLLKLLLAEKQLNKAYKTATEILKMKPLKVTHLTKLYQNEAFKVVEKYGFRFKSKPIKSLKYLPINI